MCQTAAISARSSKGSMKVNVRRTLLIVAALSMALHLGGCGGQQCGGPPIFMPEPDEAPTTPVENSDTAATIELP